MVKKMSKLDAIAYILLVIGGLNWGAFAFLKFNVVELLGFLKYPVYLAVFLAAVYSGVKGLKGFK